MRGRRRPDQQVLAHEALITVFGSRLDPTLVRQRHPGLRPVELLGAQLREQSQRRASAGDHEARSTARGDRFFQVHLDLARERRGQRLAVGKAVLVDPAGRHYSSFLQANPSRPIRELAAAGPQLPAV